MRGAIYDIVYILVLTALYQHINQVLKKINRYYKVLIFVDDQ